MIVIGLSGKKYSGKDTFCSAIQKVSDLPVKRIALADPLKDEVYQFILKPHNIDRQALDDARKKHFRLILQGWGTDFKRYFFGTDYWIIKLDETLKSPAFKDFQGIVVITDIRFRDEAEYVNKINGILVRIVRPEKSFWRSLVNRLRKLDNHPSETALDDYKFDNYICNDGTIEDLEQKAEVFIENLRAKYHI